MGFSDELIQVVSDGRKLTHGFGSKDGSGNDDLDKGAKPLGIFLFSFLSSSAFAADESGPHTNNTEMAALKNQIETLKKQNNILIRQNKDIKSRISVLKNSTTSQDTEKIMSGFDAEIGYRIPWLDNTPFGDIRVYSGYFHFEADDTKNISGPRYHLHSHFND